MNGLICPGCGSVVPNNQLLGIEVPGVYDGVLIWRDEGCGHTWPRFDPPGRLHDTAAKWIEALR